MKLNKREKHLLVYILNTMVKDIYECIYVDYMYDEEIEKLIISDLVYSEEYTADEISYIKSHMNGYYFDVENMEIRLIKEEI